MALQILDSYGKNRMQSVKINDIRTQLQAAVPQGIVLGLSGIFIYIY